MPWTYRQRLGSTWRERRSNSAPRRSPRASQRRRPWSGPSMSRSSRAKERDEENAYEEVHEDTQEYVLVGLKSYGSFRRRPPEITVLLPDGLARLFGFTS